MHLGEEDRGQLSNGYESGDGGHKHHVTIKLLLHQTLEEIDSVVQNLPANAGDAGNVSSIPRSGRSPGGGYGNPLQYSGLENYMDKGAWWATVHGDPKS